MLDQNHKNPRRKHRQQNLGHCLQKYILLDTYPQGRETKEKNKQMGLHQTKRFFTAKETTNKIKIQATECVNIFSDISDKELNTKIQKEVIKLNTKIKKKIQLKDWAKDTSPKRTYRWPIDI